MDYVTLNWIVFAALFILCAVRFISIYLKLNDEFIK